MIAITNHKKNCLSVSDKAKQNNSLSASVQEVNIVYLMNCTDEHA